MTTTATEEKTAKELFEEQMVATVGGSSDEKVYEEPIEPPVDPEEKKQKDKEILPGMLAKQMDTKPFVHNQEEKYPSTVKTSRIEYKVFDLAKAEDALKAGEYETLDMDPTSGIQIIFQDTKFCETSGSWKLLLKLAYLTYYNPLADE